MASCSFATANLSELSNGSPISSLSIAGVLRHKTVHSLGTVSFTSSFRPMLDVNCCLSHRYPLLVAIGALSEVCLPGHLSNFTDIVRTVLSDRLREGPEDIGVRVSPPSTYLLGPGHRSQPPSLEAEQESRGIRLEQLHLIVKLH